MSSYNDFIFIKDEQGKYKVVNCSKSKHRSWKTTAEWKEYDKNDKIVVFVYQGKIMADTFFFTLAFTTKENFQNRFKQNFDFDKICKIGAEYTKFLDVQEFLSSEFGYKTENIFEECNDMHRIYQLGIFNI